MRIRIQTGASTPIYRQISEQIKAAVLRAEVTEGDRLPSIRELAKELAINPTTVVKAYDLLVSGIAVCRSLTVTLHRRGNVTMAHRRSLSTGG